MKKRFLLLLCMIACLFSLVACGKSTEKNTKKAIEYDEITLKQNLDTLIDQLNSMSKAEIKKALSELDEGSADYIIFESWLNNKDELGAFVQTNVYEFSSTDKEVRCVLSTTFEKRDATITLVISDESPSFNIDPHYTLGEKMKRAVLNTLLGMGTVFIVLIIISFLISLFKVINTVENKIKAKNEARENDKNAAKNAVDNTIAQIVEKEESNLVDDTELVAVITAAIHAYEEHSVAPTDFVVRSIKRVKKNNWNRV